LWLPNSVDVDRFSAVIVRSGTRYEDTRTKLSLSALTYTFVYDNNTIHLTTSDYLYNNVILVLTHTRVNQHSVKGLKNHFNILYAHHYGITDLKKIISKIIESLG